MDDVAVLCDAIEQKFKKHLGRRVFTVAISGIDGSGKGHVAKLVQEVLETRGHSIASINIDPWQNPLAIRLKKSDAGKNFYDSAFRWREFFNQLITPLQEHRTIDLHTTLIATHADKYYPFTYSYINPDILLIEGIFLFKQEYVAGYDYRVWIDCSFEKALQRAISRNVEKLPESQLVEDYNTYYYPAQRLHFEVDDPIHGADFIFNNQ